MGLVLGSEIVGLGFCRVQGLLGHQALLFLLSFVLLDKF